MAAALYNHATNSADASSAGVHVDIPGQTLEARRATSISSQFFLFDVMDELNLDIRQNTRTQLTPQDLDVYERIVCMADPADTPQWLLDSPKYTYWDIADPRDKDVNFAREVRDQIKEQITKLINEQKSS